MACRSQHGRFGRLRICDQDVDSLQAQLAFDASPQLQAQCPAIRAGLGQLDQQVYITATQFRPRA